MMISEPLGRRLLGLFTSYFKIASFTLGGGMVMLPLMEDEFVRKRKWLNSEEFMDVVTLINALPGMIAVNSSIIIGRKVAGIPGAAAAMLGGMVPSILIILLLAPVIAAIRGVPIVSSAFISVRSGVAALILVLIIRQAVKMNLGFREMVLSAAALIAVRVGGLHPILIIPVAGLVGFFLYYPEERERSE